MKNKILSLLALSAILTVSSCTNLDETVYDRNPMDGTGKSEKEMQAVISGAYTTLRGFSDSDKGGTNCYPTGEFVFFVNECVSDEATIPTRVGGDWGDGGRYRELQQHTWTANNVLFSANWKYCYQGIATINAAIYQVEQSLMTKEAKDKTNAELRGLRAYYYYLLLDQFGNVPLVTEFKKDAEYPANTSREEVFKFVEDELKAIVDLLPATKTYSKFTQGVAYSILARLYLNAEVYTGTPRWQDCINACDKVTGYIIEDNYFESFKTNNEISNEIIFSVPYDHKAGTVGNYLASMTYHYEQKYAFSKDGSYPWCGNGICAQPGLYSSFDANDIRRNSLLIGPQISLSTGEVIKMANGMPLDYTEEITTIMESPQNEGARLHKYEVRADDQWERDHDLVLIRYAEIVMSKAEALFRMGSKSSALPLVNELRNRAGLTDLSDLTLESLDKEWRHEFVFEGIRRTVNIRFGTFFEPWWQKEASDKTRGLYPIPVSQLQLNKNLKQNPGY
ncbi:MAG: RagB/SusD family nutrient uptake outer membrane protein [Dysgonomonas sp.]